MWIRQCNLYMEGHLNLRLQSLSWEFPNDPYRVSLKYLTYSRIQFIKSFSPPPLSLKRQNGLTNRAAIFCGTSHNSREGFMVANAQNYKIIVSNFRKIPTKKNCKSGKFLIIVLLKIIQMLRDWAIIKSLNRDFKV